MNVRIDGRLAMTGPFLKLAKLPSGRPGGSGRGVKNRAINDSKSSTPPGRLISQPFLFFSLSRSQPRFRRGPGHGGMEFVVGTGSLNNIASNPLQASRFGPRALPASPESLAPQRHSPLPPIMDRLRTSQQYPSRRATCQLPLGTRSPRWRCIEEPLSLERNFFLSMPFHRTSLPVRFTGLA